MEAMEEVFSLETRAEFHQVMRSRSFEERLFEEKLGKVEAKERMLEKKLDRLEAKDVVSRSFEERQDQGKVSEELGVTRVGKMTGEINYADEDLVDEEVGTHKDSKTEQEAFCMGFIG